MGGCYEAGAGVKKDAEQAVYWYRKSAEQGTKEAQYKLASCYERGMGVPKNIEQAVYWYRKSAEQGYPPAKRALKKLGR